VMSPGTPDQQGVEATKNLRIEILFVPGIEENKFHALPFPL